MTQATTIQATQKLVSDFRVLVADAEDLVQATTAQAGDKIAEVRGRVQQSVADLKPRLARVEATLREQANAAVTTTDEYVRAQPWTAVGVAAGLGLIIGILVGRR